MTLNMQIQTSSVLTFPLHQPQKHVYTHCHAIISQTMHDTMHSLYEDLKNVFKNHLYHTGESEPALAVYQSQGHGLANPPSRRTRHPRFHVINGHNMHEIIILIYINVNYSHLFPFYPYKVSLKLRSRSISRKGMVSRTRLREEQDILASTL